MSYRAVIQGVGHGLPEGRLTNADLERMVETSDEWIVQRTGIKERRISTVEEPTSKFAVMAGKEALENAKMDPNELDVIIVATVTGDMPFPSTACIVQDEIGAVNAGAFDVGAACAGFIYALGVAGSMIESRRAKTALVIGADTLTKTVDWTDRSTCVLFGDGGAAVVLRGEENTDRGVLETVLRSDGSGRNHIHYQVYGSLYPAKAEITKTVHPYTYMAGQEVYRFAVKSMGDACLSVLEMAGLSSDDVDLFVPHQANLRIIESAAKRLGLPDEKVFINVHNYGNTSGGSIPLGLYEAVQTGRLQKGMLVMTVGFGAGLVWGANLIRW